MQNKNTAHNAALDGLRGLACIWVILSHMDAFVGTATSSTGTYSQASLLWRFYRRLIDGNFPVSVFFVLSGYVLLLGFDRSNNVDQLSRAAVKRYFRLMPMALFSVLLAWAVSNSIGFHNAEAAKAIGGHNWLAQYYPDRLLFWHSVRVGMLGAFTGDDLYNFPLWTMRVELFGSLLLFAVAALFYKNRNFWVVCVAATFTLCYLCGNFGVYYALFLVGAMLLRYQSIRLPAWGIVVALMLGSENIWTPEAFWAAPYLHFTGIDFDVMCHAIASVLLVSSVLKSPSASRVLSCRPVAYLGKLSFAMYALHAVVMLSVGSHILSLGPEYGHPRQFAAIGFVVTFAVTILISHLAYGAIDGGAQRWSSRIADAFLNARRPRASHQLPEME